MEEEVVEEVVEERWRWRWRRVTCAPLTFDVEKTVRVTIMCEREDCSLRLVAPTERLVLPSAIAVAAPSLSVIPVEVSPGHIIPITSSFCTEKFISFCFLPSPRRSRIRSL